MWEQGTNPHYSFATRHQSVNKDSAWPSTDALNYLFGGSEDPFIASLGHLLLVATDFVCGPKIEADPTCWAAMETPYTTWLQRLHNWRDGTGALAIQILNLVLDSFGEGANVGAYYETKRTATYVWFSICEITRDVARLTVPGSDLITFRHRCATWLSLAVRAWDSLWAAVADDMQALGRERYICPGEMGKAKTLRNLLQEGLLFKQDFDEETFRSVARSIGPVPEFVVNRAVKRAGLLGIKSNSTYPCCPKARREGLYLKSKL